MVQVEFEANQRLHEYEEGGRIFGCGAPANVEVNSSFVSHIKSATPSKVDVNVKPILKRFC